jgi:hypothetical protein
MNISKQRDFLLKEIKVNKPPSPIEFENLNKLKGFIIVRLKEIIEDEINISLSSLLENENVIKYIINDMISNNHEIVRKGEEILVSHSNINLLNEKDISNYLENNNQLDEYFKSLILEFYYDQIDINSIYKKAKDELKKFEIEDDEEVTNWDLKYISNNIMDNDEDIYLEDITWDNPEFDNFINSKLIRINEIKVNKPKRIWDFNKYIPNFTGKYIQIGDKIKIPEKYVEMYYKDGIINILGIEDEIPLNFYTDYGYWDADYLMIINNRNK